MRKIIVYILMVSGFLAQAQVAIGTDSPVESSVLDITATDKGIVLPSYELTSLTDNMNPIKNPVDGLMIYNTGGTYRKGIYTWIDNAWGKVFNQLDVNKVLSLQAHGRAIEYDATNNPLDTITLKANTIPGASLSSDKSTIHLPAGKYKITLSVDGYLRETTSDFNTSSSNSLYRSSYISYITYLKSGDEVLTKPVENNQVSRSFFSQYWTHYLELTEPKDFKVYIDATADNNPTNVFLIRSDFNIFIYQFKE